MNGARLACTTLRLCHRKQLEPCLLARRTFSLQSTIESIASTQSGIFKSISESKPVECVQDLLLNVHDFTGLPWWATIMCTTVMLRATITVPLAIYQQYIMARVENINLEMPEIANELKKEVAYAIQLYKWDEKTAKIHYRVSLKKQYNKLIVRDNCHPFKATILFWFQIPLWVSFSVSLRNLIYELPHQDFAAKLTFTELTVGGFGWIPNLVEVDQSLILPIAVGFINLAIIEIQNMSRVSVPSKFSRYATNFFRGFSLIMIPIAASVPSCIALYWTTSSAFGLAQNLVLMSPKLKRLCYVPQTPSQLDKPYSHLLETFKQRISFTKK